MRSDKNTVSPLMLEKYLLDELSFVDKQFVRESIEKDISLQIRLDKMKTENQQFQKQHPFKLHSHTDNTVTFSEKKSFNLKPLFAIAASAVFAAVALTMLAPVHDETIQPVFNEPETVRLKGIQPDLKIYRKVRDKIEKLKDGSKVSTNDTLQISYVSGGAKHGVIYSLDGNQQITLHFPESEEDSTKLFQSGENQLAYAYQLDNAPNFERFYFFTSNKPINVKELINQARLDKHNIQFNGTSKTLKVTTINLNKE